MGDEEEKMSDLIVYNSKNEKNRIRTIECWIALIKLNEVTNYEVKKIEALVEFDEPLTKDSIYPIIKITV